MEEDDYESLPPESTMGTHMLAGAAAGIMEHSIMYPVDCIKVTILKCERMSPLITSGSISSLNLRNHGPFIYG